MLHAARGRSTQFRGAISGERIEPSADIEQRHCRRAPGADGKRLLTAVHAHDLSRWSTASAEAARAARRGNRHGDVAEFDTYGAWLLQRLTRE